MNEHSEFELSLNLGLGTKITQAHVDAAYREAKSYETGSHSQIAFLAYARRLKNALAKLEDDK